jgi:exopolyphosphatase/guanosine-5'-triphosphate,3'-diphosphate pyrophosphatase
MLKAIIDLGTNTFNLLIAEVRDNGFQIIHAEKDGVALGMGGIHKKIIAEDALKRAFQTLQHFKETIDHHHVNQVKAFGTSAIRDALNANELVDFIQNQLGIPVDVIDGKKEAELIFSGVARTHDLMNSGLIMDIGGGSTEFIAFKENEIKDLVSLNIGVSRIFQQFSLSDPLRPEEILEIEAFLEKESNGFFNNRKETLLIGASGSFETFYEFIEEKPFPEMQLAIPLNLEHLRKVLKEMIFSTTQERDNNPWIIPIRKKMAPIAAVKTNWVLSKLPLEEILVSPFSLKEGALFEL